MFPTETESVRTSYSMVPKKIFSYLIIFYLINFIKLNIFGDICDK